MWRVHHLVNDGIEFGQRAFDDLDAFRRFEILTGDAPGPASEAKMGPLIMTSWFGADFPELGHIAALVARFLS